MGADAGVPVSVFSAAADGLAPEEFGAYARIAVAIWRAGGSLPFEPERLARIAGYTDLGKWELVWTAIRGLFMVVTGVITHNAIVTTLARRAQASGAATARWRKAGHGGNGQGGGESAQGSLNSTSGRMSQGHAMSTSGCNAASIIQAPESAPADAMLRAENGSFLRKTPEGAYAVAPAVALPKGGLGVSVLSLSPVFSDPDQTLPDPEGSGSDSGSGSDAPVRSDARASKSGDDVRAVFAHYRGLHPRCFPSPKSDSPEWTKVAARLREGYSVEDLKNAIDGYHRSPFHCGENDGNRKYLSLGLIARNADHVNAGIEYFEKPDAPVMTTKEIRGVRAAVEWANEGRRAAHG